MAIFHKLHQLEKARQALADQGVPVLHVAMDEILSATEAMINGRRTILAGTNNYLGLTFDSGCIEAACRATREEGTGTTGSRMANGTLAGHLALEKEIAAFYGQRGAMVFSTGYVANLGIIASLAGPGDIILIDADCHASIYDGCRLSGAEYIRFRHNDAADLDKRLRRLGDRAAETLLIVEGIYSMFGDRAALADIAAVKKSYGCTLLVDEAHALGVLGDHGRGCTEDAGVEDEVDFIVGTFSKSLGAIGGYCVSNHPELELVRYASRPYIFTASSSPASIASTRAALQIIAAQPELRRQLWENAEFLYQGLLESGAMMGPEAGPVIAVRLDDAHRAYRCWQGLLAAGVYVNLVLPPATPDGGSLLRCSVSAAHTREQIIAIRNAFAVQLGKNQ
ncbi:MAG: aminotransferase class I/II-fold pyridoxal phosphate-dependent enzyme [Deltaproteobacteria bacterium]|nr:aminotransferase class I/II-fold pyridoxal phosphate-dependent enzyme [Candidatus Anaeroferrophillus wilburensis]MBN2889920.1 aminotransferase class I/II-fold pyridoxal phosphate-dependent enzyme [Deltaproteobacteria bacterium]